MERYNVVPVGTQVYVLRRWTNWEIFLHSYLPLIFFFGLVVCIFVLVGNLVLGFPEIPQARADHKAVAKVEGLESRKPKKALGSTSIATGKADSILIDTESSGSFRLPSGSESDAYFSREMIKRLNWSWPTLVQAAREADVPPWCLAYLHYQEPIPHFSLVSPKNGEGIFQLHDYKVAHEAATEEDLYPYTGKKVTAEEFLEQARSAARFLQKKAKITAGRLRFDMHPFDPTALEAVYSYNGRTYAGLNPPSKGLTQRLRELGIPEDKEFARSPYIVGRMTESEKVMFLRTRGTVVIEFYGFVPLVSKLQQLYEK